MGDGWINALEELALRRAGFTLRGLNATLIEARLGRLARREGYDGAQALARAAANRPDERLAYEALEALAPSESRFFGEGFAAFEAEALPALLGAADDAPARIWCAACGAGQEAWSVAMLVEERAPAGGRGAELVATDFSEAAIEKARSGLYTRYEAQLGLPIRRLVAHFEQDGVMWRIRPTLRGRVEFRPLNLMSDLEPLGEFDAVLLRGVLPHMPGDVAERTLDRVAGRLKPGGWLLADGSSRVPARCDRLEEAGPAGLYRAAAMAAV